MIRFSTKAANRDVQEQRLRNDQPMRIAVIMMAFAAAWGCLLILLAATLPIVTVMTGRPGAQPRDSLVNYYGSSILLPASAPLLIALIVGILLYAALRYSLRSLSFFALILSAGLITAAVVGFLTYLIGIFVVPEGALLLIATIQARSAGPDGPGHPENPP
jgi:lysylphosphatidylglycerol synthetase-like protein (DUF2156 family)